LVTVVVRENGRPAVTNPCDTDVRIFIASICMVGGDVLPEVEMARLAVA